MNPETKLLHETIFNNELFKAEWVSMSQLNHWDARRARIFTSITLPAFADFDTVNFRQLAKYWNKLRVRSEL